MLDLKMEERALCRTSSSGHRKGTVTSAQPPKEPVQTHLGFSLWECERTLYCFRLLSIWQFVAVQQGIRDWKKAMVNAKGPACIWSTCCLSEQPTSQECSMSCVSGQTQSLPLEPFSQRSQGSPQYISAKASRMRTTESASQT